LVRVYSLEVRLELSDISRDFGGFFPVSVDFSTTSIHR